MTDDHQPTYTLSRGTAPLLISIPHLGTRLPEEVRAQLSDIATVLQDTDWHLDRLYGFAAELGATVLQAEVSRYAIDLNRPPNDVSLYPGQTTTGLCPTETFHGEPLYRALPEAHADATAEANAPTAAEPAATSAMPQTITAAERERRLRTYWQPYHAALAAELGRLRAAHGAVLLWDAHSIASRLPRLFDGKLPDLNFGTADGKSCAASLIEGVRACTARYPFSQVLNGRFKGGYITRQYGEPARGIHAIQLEMSQCLYMNEAPPFAYQPEQAARVQPLLREMLNAALNVLPRLPT